MASVSLGGFWLRGSMEFGNKILDLCYFEHTVCAVKLGNKIEVDFRNASVHRFDFILNTIRILQRGLRKEVSLKAYTKDIETATICIIDILRSLGTWSKEYNKLLKDTYIKSGYHAFLVLANYDGKGNLSSFSYKLTKLHGDRSHSNAWLTYLDMAYGLKNVRAIGISDSAINWELTLEDYIGLLTA